VYTTGNRKKFFSSDQILVVINGLPWVNRLTLALRYIDNDDDDNDLTIVNGVITTFIFTHFMPPDMDIVVGGLRFSPRILLLSFFFRQPLSALAE